MGSQKDKMIDLWEEVSRCTKCNIATYARSKVFGDGNVRSSIVLVGEAPGMDEDKVGHVFVGHAGQILRKCLLAAGLKPERLFICNVLKCHPPEVLEPLPSGNRKPSTKEAENCWPFLERQLKIVRPKLVVALGNTAGLALLKPEVTKVEVTKMFGQRFEKEGYEVVVTYHPQYLGYKSYDPNLEKEYVGLFKKVKKWTAK